MENIITGDFIISHIVTTGDVLFSNINTTGDVIISHISTIGDIIDIILYITPSFLYVTIRLWLISRLQCFL